MDPLIRGLLRAEAYEHAVNEFEVRETHISWVILTGEYAYKLKKPVDFGFVDFSTLERRRFCCEEELRLNRRLAEDLYLAVKPAYGPREQASFIGSGAPIEYAVQMRQFPQSAMLPVVLGRGELRVELIDHLATDVARFQCNAAVATSEMPFGSPDGVRAPVDGNFRALECAVSAAAAISRVRDWCDREFTRLMERFVERKATGKIREGHGDMHLGNMVLRGDRIEIFDCLEFNPALRWIDVISEVAFLVMDLADRGRADLGWIFLNAWLEHTGDYSGLSLWPWYYCYRAMVRAKVAALRRSQTDVTPEDAAQLEQQLADYLQLALRAIEPSQPRLVITCGVSGSGKSHWSQQMAAEHGWIRIRSDVERKRLFAGRQVEMYSEAAIAQTYQHLRDIAATVLASGLSVIVDATFLKRTQRPLFRELAREMNVPGQLIEFIASEDLLRERLSDRQRRGGDPSDATHDVLTLQLKSREPIAPEEGWEVISIPF